MATRRLVPLPQIHSGLHYGPVVPVRSAVRQAALQHIGAMRSPAYVRPAITGVNVGDEAGVVGQHSAFGDQYGDVGGALGHPPTSEAPPPPGNVGLPPPGTDWAGGVPGRGQGYLSWNPQLILPDKNVYAGFDAQFASDVGDAQTDFYTKYHDTLKKLGYMDPGGHYIPGTLETDYATGHERGLRELANEERVNTENARAAGLLFSGVRAQNLLDAQRQTTADLADLDITNQGDISQGYVDIGDARTAFNRAVNAAISEAIFRKTGTYDPSYTTPTG